MNHQPSEEKAVGILSKITIFLLFALLAIIFSFFVYSVCK